MAYFGVQKLEDGRLLVTMSATPEDDGVFADMLYYVDPSDPDYAELEGKVEQQ